MSDKATQEIIRAAKKFRSDINSLCDRIIAAFKDVPMAEIAAACAPPPTPNLDLLRRFAKVAGWSYQSNDLECGLFYMGGTINKQLTERDAGEWLDSAEALDAAAIVAVRKGGGLRYWTKHDGQKHVLVQKIAARPFDGEEVIRCADAPTAPRAAVLAVLAAFEEK